MGRGGDFDHIKKHSQKIDQSSKLENFLLPAKKNISWFLLFLACLTTSRLNFQNISNHHGD